MPNWIIQAPDRDSISEVVGFIDSARRALFPLLAEDIFSELTSQLQGITERSKIAQTKIEKINEIVEKYDPKKVPVRK